MKNRLLELMAKRQSEMSLAAGEPIEMNLAVVSRETGISRQALTVWKNQELDGLRRETVETLCEYFNCNIGDLLYLEKEQAG